jgi:peptidoglycan hydrolase-like protein with peptidoglycan-binding domain
MRTQFNFEAEPFEAYSEFEGPLEASDSEFADEEEEEEIRRGGRSFRRPAGYRASLRRPRVPPRPPFRPPERRPPTRRPWPPRPWPPRPPWGPVVVVPEPGSPPPASPGPTAPPEGTTPSEPGNEYVRWVQSSLNGILGLRLPVDGIMGPETRSAIRGFQKRQGLPVDGIVGPDTERALLAARANQAPETRNAATGSEFAEELEAFDTELADLEWEGEIARSSREYIRWVQQSLNQIMGLRLAVDGIIGPMTRSAIRSFQQRQGLSVDGIVGSRTEAALIASGASPPPARGMPSAPTGRPDIVNVRGIRVARQIAAQVEALLAAAETDGIRLGGGGYRSPEAQIELRKKHCGTTHYDIYEKPASQCVPPTAPPGKSMHEKGLAIDFTYNGRGMNSRDNPGFQWLSRNAARFGLYNLPSEPWHWSINGR